jgi:hypothetical protein
MNTQSTFSTGKGNADDSRKDSTANTHGDNCNGGCDIDIRIDCRGDVNIYNCAPSSGTSQPPQPTCPPCSSPSGTCIPVVAGAKHKLSREQKLNKLTERVLVPSSFAAGAMHMIRRFLLGKTPVNSLEAKAFATLGRMSRDILSCTVAAFDAVPPRQRNRLFAPSLLLDPDQPLDEARLSAALAQELKQRVGVLVFGDPNGTDQERPGRMRVYEPPPEDFFSQVRICKINDLRTANFIPPIPIDNYLPSEIQQDCKSNIVDGQAQVDCQVLTTNCQGNMLAGVCARVPEVALGDGVVLQGVNYFSVGARVRFTDRETGIAIRDVDAHVWGDVDTPGTEEVNGQKVLINDCRVHDRLTFSVPNDLAPKVYQIQVVVPNITGISAFGPELVSNAEFIKVIPPPTARFEIYTEWIYARQETSPAWPGSDEVGLHTLAAAMDLNFQPVTFDFLTPPSSVQEQKFKDLQDVDFDSGTPYQKHQKVFEHNQPILGMLLLVHGDEIDSQGFYDEEITSQTEYFLELLVAEAVVIGGVLKELGVTLSALSALSPLAWWLIAIGGVLLIGIDLLLVWWAPADPIIRDSIALSVNELATLTSANAPTPDPTTFTTEDGIVVNVNKTVPPVKHPLEYHETREYVSDDQDSRYEITYRFNRVA